MDNPSRRKSWAVMVFMAVDDDLAPYALADIRQMQAVGSSKDVDIIVQLNWKNASIERHRVLSTDIEPLTVPGLPADATSLDALAALLQQIQVDCPADHYMLQLWGHAYGVGFGRSNDDRMPLAGLARVLTDFANDRQGLKLEVLAGVTCRMSKIETAYELRDAVRFLVASQVGVPFLGWPYKAFLADLVKRPSLTPAELGGIIVSYFCESYRRRTVTMTMLDLEAGEQVLIGLQALGKALYEEVQRGEHAPQMLHDACRQAAYDDVEPLVDLYEICARLGAMTRNPNIRSAADELMGTLRASRFVTAHDGVGPRADQLHGVGIYVPQLALATSLPSFTDLGFDRSRLWRDVLDSVTDKAPEG
jgi:hypothetical protein